MDILKNVPDHLRKHPSMKAYLEDLEARIAEGEILPSPNVSLQATPLVEVSSISIHGNGSELFEDGKPCKIYGVVQVLKGDDVLFSLYKRDMRKPKVVSLGGTIPLRTPSNCALSPSPNIRLKIKLVDMYRKVEIANDVIDFATGWEDCSEVNKREIVKGEFGFAKVSYSLYRSAVVANIGVKIINKKHCASPFKIYGSIYARCESEFGPSNNFDGDGGEPFASLLFNKDECSPLEVKSGDLIDLTRCSVAVPAYGSLTLDLRLSESQKLFVMDSVEFEPSYRNKFTEKLKADVPGQTCEIEVLVEWVHADVLAWNQASHVATSQVSTINWEPALKTRICDAVVEVFSVFLDRGEYKKINSIYGFVRVSPAAMESFYLFDRDIQDPTPSLIDDHMLPLKSPNVTLLGSCLDMDLDLKSADSDFAVYGNVSMGMISQELGRPWYDMPICAVIRGQHGYAALHFTMLSCAVYASVEVSLVDNGKSYAAAKCYGSLVSEYSDWDYCSSYDKKYFRTILLERSQESPLQILGGSKLRLTKSRVAVPLQSSLRICGDLSVHPISVPSEPKSQGGDYLKFTAEFKAKTDGESSHPINSKNYCFLISVKWSEDLC